MSCDVGCMLVREASADKQRAQELLDTAVKNVELDEAQLPTTVCNICAFGWRLIENDGFWWPGSA